MSASLPAWGFAGADVDLLAFVRESNRIEGIKRMTSAQVAAHEHFVFRPRITVQDLVDLVAVLQPDARLRDSADAPGVRVGNHIAPPSGPHIRRELEDILASAGDSYHQHVAYETLHPFTDGNGRSGRALWLHRRGAYAPLGFLASLLLSDAGTFAAMTPVRKLAPVPASAASRLRAAFKREDDLIAELAQVREEQKGLRRDYAHDHGLLILPSFETLRKVVG